MKKLFFIVFLFMTLPAMAQMHINIDSLVVRGTRPQAQAALSISTIDSVQLANSSAGSLSELIGRYTPLFVKSYGGGSSATVSFRGTAASHTRVDWNGININNPMLGETDLSMFPVSFIDKVELLHGGSSLSEGGGALGGQLSMTSLPRWGKKIYAEVQENIGSFGFTNTNISVGGGSDRIQSSIRAIYERADNNFKYVNTAIPPFDEVRQYNADYYKWGVTADVNARVSSKDIIGLNFWYVSADRNLPSIMSYEGKGRDESQTDRDLRTALSWRRYGKKVTHRAVSGVTYTRLNYFLANNTDLGRVVNYDSRSSALSVYNNYNLNWKITERTTFKASAEVNIHSVSIFDYIDAGGYSADRFQAGVSASISHRFGNILSVYGLLRQELSDSKLTPIMPLAGVDVSPFKNHDLHLRATVSRNYHQPTLNDLYWSPGGNPDLKPEKGISSDIEAAYSLSKSRYSLDATVRGYFSRIDDWIIWQPGEYRYWTAENIREVYARGLELNSSVGYTLYKWFFSVGVNYAFTKTTNRKAKGEGDIAVDKQLIYIPVNKAGIEGRAQWRGFELMYMWNYVGERFTTSSNEVTRHQLPAYSLHDIAINKKINFRRCALTASFKVNNLLDKSYQAILWRAMPGRNYLLQLTFSL